jgi:hypothetical protein
VILTVSRIEADKRSNPGYRVVLRERLQRHAPARALLRGRCSSSGRRACARSGRDVRPARAPRRARTRSCARPMCVIVRDLIVYGVITDMMKGRPVVYATFSSYDEVAHHSGLERADTLEAPAQARRAVRPHRPRAVVRAAAVRDRRPVGPRTDAGRDVPAAQRLCARRPRRRVARDRRRDRVVGRRRERGDGRQRAEGGDRRACRRKAGGAAERGVRARLRQSRAHLSDGLRSPADARRDRGAAPPVC